MINSNRFLLLLLVVFGFHLPSYGQKDLPSLNKLSKDADVILTGKVVHKKSGWNADKTRIYTKTTLQVEEYLKGTTNENSLDITYPGGEVGDIGEIYTHMPKFEAEEEVLVFLKKDIKTKEYNVLHGEEGKIKLLRDAKSKGKMSPSNLWIKEIKSQIKSYLNKK